jgi:hypothetical protein
VPAMPIILAVNEGSTCPRWNRHYIEQKPAPASSLIGFFLLLANN